MGMAVVWSAMAHLMESSFSDLDSYLLTVEGSLRREKERFEAIVKEELDGLDDDDADERAELYAEDFDQMATTFPNISGQSGFVMTYSRFEYWLLVLCWRTQKLEKQAFGPQDVKGDFNGTQTYLLRMAQIKMSDCQGWSKVNDLRQIRNHLVHQGGQVRDADTKFVELVNRTAGAELDEQKRLTINRAFCIGAIETLREFLNDLIGKLRLRFHD